MKTRSTELHDHPVALPQWLSTKDPTRSPFSEHTRATLSREVQKHPRLAQAITQLQKNIEPGSKEWGLVENFCRDASKQLLESHEHFVKANHCQTERSLLILGAYMSDYSFTKFFQDLHHKLNNRGNTDPALTEKERRTYCEAVRVALPIVAEVQPRVAMQFAQTILRSQMWYDQQPAVQALYEKLAAEQPRMMLTMFDRFKTFQNREKLHDIAQEARANEPVEPLRLGMNTEIPASAAQQDEAQIQFLEKYRPEFFGLGHGVQRG